MCISANTCKNKYLSSPLLPFCNAKNAFLCLLIFAKNDAQYPEEEKCTSDIKFLSVIKAGH